MWPGVHRCILNTSQESKMEVLVKTSFRPRFGE